MRGDVAWRKSTASADQGACAEAAAVPDIGAWRKSSHSNFNGSCAEVRQDGAGVLMRDSKAPDGPWLPLDAVAWMAFVAMVRSG